MVPRSDVGSKWNVIYQLIEDYSEGGMSKEEAEDLISRIVKARRIDQNKWRLSIDKVKKNVK